MHVRTVTLTTVGVLVATLTACTSDKPGHPATATPQQAAANHHYVTAQAIADALKRGGLTVSPLHEETGDNYIKQVGGQSYDFTVAEEGHTAPGDSGINMFPNADALRTWIPLSKGFGGVAVTGDTWAVSLPTTGDARDDSVRLAPTVAKALGGVVQQ